MATIEVVKNDFESTMQKMMDRANGSGAFARIYPLYQKLQVKRLETEGASEGNRWEPLQAQYELYKKKRYGGGPKRSGGSWRSWPGSGTKMLIGTSTLAGAIIGPGSPFVSEGIKQHRARFTKNSMEIAVSQSENNAEGRPFNYASSVDENRPFMEFSDASLVMMKEAFQKFIAGE